MPAMHPNDLAIEATANIAFALEQTDKALAVLANSLGLMNFAAPNFDELLRKTVAVFLEDKLASGIRWRRCASWKRRWSKSGRKFSAGQYPGAATP